MTDNEIVKALECLSSWSFKNCKGCPLEEEYPNCAEYVTYPAVELINRQKAEIERLKKARDGWRDTAYHEASNAENLSNKAIKDFAERLKAKFDQYGVGYYPYALVDDVLEEMGLNNEKA